MKLAAIYNVFDGEELLEGSINQIRDHVDVVICVVQTVSNYNEVYDGGYEKVFRLWMDGLVNSFIFYTPIVTDSGAKNETRKRNIGIQKSIELDCTHYISIDCDEYYNTEDFAKAKDMCEIYSSTYVPLKTYFSPNHILTPNENYYVPFICKLYKDTKVGGYDFGGVYCDPTRKDNSNNTPYNLGNEGIYMHHYSWVRNDLERKINNSSANINLKNYKNDLIEFCKNPKTGIEIPFYKGHQLEEVEDKFNIERYL